MNLAQAVIAGAEEIEKAQIPENLKLLADFFADVGVVGVQAGELAGVGVDVGEGEVGFVEGADGVEDVEGPAAFFDGELFEGAEALVGLADAARGQGLAVFDDGDAGVLGNFIEEDVAADIAGAASGGSERFAAFDGGKGKGEMGYEDDGAHGPLREVVVQDVEIGCAVFEDGALHFGVGGIEDFAAEDF